MLDLYRRAIEQIRAELDGWNAGEINDYRFADNIENIVIDLEEMVEKAKEIKLVEEVGR